jgi:hypothetical protein
MRPDIEGIIEKKIKSVVVSECNRCGPPSQVFLVFDDNTYIEFYGEIGCAGGPASGSENTALTYASKAAGTITIYGQSTEHHA